MNGIVQRTFSLVCSQDPSHTWAPGGELLPMCQRCTGFYVGVTIALILMLLFRPSPDARYRWLHVLLVLSMTPFGFHLVWQDAVLRTMSGYWFGFGVVGLLWLQPGTRFFAEAGSDACSGRKLHLFAGAASLLLLPAYARWGGRFAAATLPWLALAGLMIVAGLLLANVILLLSGILNWIRRPNGRASS